MLVRVSLDRRWRRQFARDVAAAKLNRNMRSVKLAGDTSHWPPPNTCAANSRLSRATQNEIAFFVFKSVRRRRRRPPLAERGAFLCACARLHFSGQGATYRSGPLGAWRGGASGRAAATDYSLVEHLELSFCGGASLAPIARRKCRRNAC